MSTSHRWHQASVFGTGPRRPLDREQRSRFVFLLRAHRINKRLTPYAEHVGLALFKRLSIDGQCDPEYQTIARDAGCSERTVGRALGALKALGLLVWQRRLVRNEWRAVQTSNAYILVPASGNVLTSSAPARSRQKGRQTKSKYIKDLYSPSQVSLQDEWCAVPTSNADSLVPASGNLQVSPAPACGGQKGRETESKYIKSPYSRPGVSLQDQQNAQQALARRCQLIEERLLDTRRARA